MTDNVQTQLPRRFLSAEKETDWGAALAGAFVATAILLLLMAFSSAIGLSLLSPYHGKSPWIYYIAAGLWMLFITVSSFASGAYVTGRLRRRVDEASLHETHIRDGVHGLIVWAVAVVIGALVATSSVGALLKSGKDVALATANSSVADTLAYQTDRLLRGDGDVARNTPATDIQRQAANRIMGTAIASNGELDADDRGYLSNLISSRTGLAPSEAEARINASMASIKNAQEKAKEAADAARKVGVFVAFLIAVSLVLGAATAWWATCVGGAHRDGRYDLSHLTRW